MGRSNFVSSLRIVPPEWNSKGGGTPISASAGHYECRRSDWESKRMKAGTGQKSGGREESLKMYRRATAQSWTLVAVRRGLDTEAGCQRVKRQDGFDISRISEAGSTRSLMDWRSEDLDRYRRDQGLYPKIGAVLQQP